MLAVVVGLIFAVIGLWGMVTWWPDFLIVMKGFLPLMLICGGLLAMIAGMSSIKDVLDGKAEGQKEQNEKKS